MSLRFFLRFLAVCTTFIGIGSASAFASGEYQSKEAPHRHRAQNWWDHVPNERHPPTPESVRQSFKDDFPKEILRYSNNYQSTYTFRENAYEYSVDPYVWGYTREFAERFYMPEKWIVSDLKGASAVAFRMMEPNVFYCGLGGDENACTTERVCQLDVYYDSRHTALPWNTPRILRDNLMQGVHSGMFLYDPEYVYRSLNHHFYKAPSPDGVSQPGPLASGGRLYHAGIPIGDVGEVVHFDQAQAPASGLISWHGVCPQTPGPGPITMPFYSDDGTLLHEVTFPKAWLQRAHTVWKDGSQQKAKMPLERHEWERERFTGIGGWMTRAWHTLTTWEEDFPEDSSIDTEHYQRRFTFRDKKTFIRDPWIWGYTREFAERFRMPEKWIEPDLKGALAIAYRMTGQGRRQCGYARIPDACDQALFVQMDVYYDTATTSLPWVQGDGVQRDSLIPLTTSTTLLSGAEQPTKSTLNRYFYYGKGRSDPDFGKGEKGVLKNHYVDFFDRAYRPGVGLLSFIRRSPASYSTIHTVIEFADLKDVELMYQGKIKSEDIGVMHRIEVPERLFARVQEMFAMNSADHRHTSDRIFRKASKRMKELGLW